VHIQNVERQNVERQNTERQNVERQNVERQTVDTSKHLFGTLATLSERGRDRKAVLPKGQLRPHDKRSRKKLCITDMMLCYIMNLRKKQ
jgi:hypothetical protein